MILDLRVLLDFRHWHACSFKRDYAHTDYYDNKIFVHRTNAAGLQFYSTSIRYLIEKLEQNYEIRSHS